MDWYLVSEINFYIDGVDAVSANLFMIKGKGGALFEEKMAFKLSKSIYIIANWTKHVERFENYSIPIEILPSSRRFVSIELQKLNTISTNLRESSGKIGPVITDNGNFLLDVVFEPETLKDLIQLETNIKTITGVVESGLFCPIPNMNIFICKQDGAVSIMTNC